MMIDDIIEKLKALQEIFSKKFAVEAEIANIPHRLNTKQEMLYRIKQSVTEKNNTIVTLKEDTLKVKERIRITEDNREQYEMQMENIKTQRQYEALNLEIQEATAQFQQSRRELQTLETRLKDITDEIDREYQLMQVQEDELEQEKNKVTEETKKWQSNLEKLQAEESKITPDLDDELLFKFQRIVRQKEGSGIVALRNGVCTGCHMVTPHQFINDVRSAERIFFCPYCSRIVFYIDTEEYAIETDDMAKMVQSFGDEYHDDFDLDEAFDESPLVIGSDDDDEYDEEYDNEEEGDTPHAEESEDDTEEEYDIAIDDDNESGDDEERVNDDANPLPHDDTDLNEEKIHE